MNPATQANHPETDLNVDNAVESSSDSDWLEIGDNRDSDDNDSSSLCSDHNEISSLPLSRRSSMSIGSSREGEIEAWEGFVSDSSEEDFVGAGHPAHYVMQRAGGVSVAPTDGSPASASPVDEVDPQEEQRVRDALDQSFVSTLSSSRSPPGTVHNSIRDLRLSFPDPLTSSENSLNRSFEAVSVPRISPTPPVEIESADSDPVAKEESSIVSDGGDLEQEDADNAPNVNAEPTVPPVTETPQPTEQHSEQVPDLEVYLYGASPLLKRLFARELLEKASMEEISDKESAITTARTYTIYDYTVHSGASMPTSKVASGRPSLAIVYLPCESLHVQQLPEHTMYLPVSSSVMGAGTVSKIMPLSQVMRFGGELVTRMADLEHVREGAVRAAVSDLFNPRRHTLKKRPSFGVLRSSKNAVTFFALVSLAVGIAVNTTIRSFSSSSIPAPSATVVDAVTPGLWDILGNHSTGLSLRTPTSVSVRSSSRVPAVLTETTLAEKQVAKAEAFTTKDVMVRPPTSITASPSNMEASTSATTLEMMRPSSTSALSLKFVDSISEFVDQSKAALKIVDQSTEVFRSRMQDRFTEMQDKLTEAFDVIEDVINQAMEESKGKAHDIRDALVYRNNRAKSNAVLLKEKGKQLLADRTDHAKQRAKALVSKTSGDGGGTDGGGRAVAAEQHHILPRIFA